MQTDVKRMLAYSSISHAGYILIGVQAATRRRERAPRSSTLLAYALMVVGAFAVVSVVARNRDDDRHSLSYRGLARATARCSPGC
mgnify:CR=1 FL=1